MQTAPDHPDHLVLVQDLTTEGNLAIVINYPLPNVTDRSLVAETYDLGAEVRTLVKL